VNRGITKGVLAASALILCIACRTHQIGATFEMRDNASVLGGFLGTDLGEGVETSLVYIHNTRPEIPETSVQSVGCDFILKYPVHFANNHISIFPMAGLEGRYILSFTDIIEEKISEGNILEGNIAEGNWAGGNLGFGVKFGVGMDISFSTFLFLRTTVLYQPEITTFMDGSSGLRFNASLGYRTKNNPLRIGFTQVRTARQRELMEENLEQNLIRATAYNPNNPQVFYELALYYRTEGKSVLAAAAMEKALGLDPAFKHTPASESYFKPDKAALLGIETADNFTFGDNYSLNYLLGCMYFDAANGTGNDRDKVVEDTDRRRTLEKSLAAFRRGYEIDITGGETGDVNLKAVYLSLIGKTLDILDRKDEATETYIVLSRTTNVTSDVALRIADAGTGQSNYVSAGGR